MHPRNVSNANIVGSFLSSNKSDQHGESCLRNEVSESHNSMLCFQNSTPIKSVSSLLNFKFGNVRGSNMTRFSVLEAQSLSDEVHSFSASNSFYFCSNMINFDGEVKSIHISLAVMDQLNQVVMCQFSIYFVKLIFPLRPYFWHVSGQ
jgi:hypothetical protein